MSSQVAPQQPPTRRGSLTNKRQPSTKKLGPPSENGATINGVSKPTSPSASVTGGERTVKKLRLSKALTIPEATSVSDACRRMAARRVDAVLLTDSNALLSGIVTDKDITTRVIAEELRTDQTPLVKIMTRNPTFVTSDTLGIDALQKMVQGKFRHLPVVENGEVIALLDITKCLYDAISRMEKAAEQGSAIAAAVEGVERQMGNNFAAPAAFIETLRERMFKPALSTIITENTKVATVSPSDPVYVAAKRMRDFRVNSVIITSGSKVLGILTSRDILMRVVAQNLSPELTLVEKVMTPNPECVNVEATILEALHIMHDGKFLHIPVLDRDGSIAACVDVLQLTHAAISMSIATKSSKNAIPDSEEILHHRPKFQIYKELSSKLNYINTIYPTLEPISPYIEPQNRIKRRRTCKEPSFQQLVAPNQINVGLTDKYQSPNKQIDFFNSPQSFTFESNEANTSILGFDPKISSYSTKNRNRLSRKSTLGSSKDLRNASLLAFDRDTIENQKKDVEWCSYFSKEIEDAIRRIESLIPSLHELVNSVHGKSGMPNISSSVNSIKQEKDGLIRTNEPGLIDNSGALDENMVGKKASQMTTKFNVPTPPSVKWSKSVKCVDDNPKNNEMNLLNLQKTRIMIDQSLTQVSIPDDGEMRNLNLEKIPNAKISQVPKIKAKENMSTSQNLESKQSSRIMPHQPYQEEAKDATLRLSTEVKFVGSTSFRDNESTSSMDTSHQKNLQARRDSLHRNDEIKKVIPHDETSEETSKSSSVSSSATTQESGSPSSSSGTYQSYGTDDSYDSEESEPHHEKVGRSTRVKQPELSDRNRGYNDNDDDDDDDDSFSDDSREEYSDAVGPSSPISSVRAPKWSPQKQKGEKARGKIRKFREKLGMIFHHHHHHHHHHYGDKDEDDVHHSKSIWKRVGEIFHHSRNSDQRQKPKTEKLMKSETKKPSKSEGGNFKKSAIKTLVKKKDQIKHFHALVGGLMKHVKDSKKAKMPKNVKNGIKKLGAIKSKSKKLPWWPKFNGKKGGVKVCMPNKGKSKFKNFYRTKSLAAAKLILGKK